MKPGAADRFVGDVSSQVIPWQWCLDQQFLRLIIIDCLLLTSCSRQSRRSRQPAARSVWMFGYLSFTHYLFHLLPHIPRVIVTISSHNTAIVHLKSKARPHSQGEYDRWSHLHDESDCVLHYHDEEEPEVFPFRLDRVQQGLNKRTWFVIGRKEFEPNCVVTV